MDFHGNPKNRKYIPIRNIKKIIRKSDFLLIIGCFIIHNLPCAIERKLWDLSVSRLVSLKEFLRNDSSFIAVDKIQLKVIETFNKVWFREN